VVVGLVVFSDAPTAKRAGKSLLGHIPVDHPSQAWVYPKHFDEFVGVDPVERVTDMVENFCEILGGMTLPGMRACHGFLAFKEGLSAVFQRSDPAEVTTVLHYPSTTGGCIRGSATGTRF
jgi:hypothetical protein